MKFTRLVTDASRLGFVARDALRGAVALSTHDTKKPTTDKKPVAPKRK